MSQSNSKFAIPPQKGFDPIKYRDNPAAIAEFLNSALGKDDLAEFVRAIGAIPHQPCRRGLRGARRVRRGAGLREHLPPPLAAGGSAL